MNGFQKISRVRGLLGNTKWYLNEDCLLAAKQAMYAVEYRRFYLRDLESVVVWPNRWWPLQWIIPGVLLGGSGVSLWAWVDHTSGAIVGGIALAWVAVELALGPTCRSRIRTTGAGIDLALATRVRRARKVLARIDAAVRANRSALEQQLGAAAAATEVAQTFVPAGQEVTPAASTTDATEANAS